MADPDASDRARQNIRRRLTDVEFKVGILGPAIGDAQGARLVHEHARRSGVIVTPDNKFQCPPGTARGGSFTDPLGSTCGIPDPKKEKEVVDVAADVKPDSPADASTDSPLQSLIDLENQRVLEERTARASEGGALEGAKALLESVDTLDAYFHNAFLIAEDIDGMPLRNRYHRQMLRPMTEMNPLLVSGLKAAAPDGFVPPIGVREAAKTGLKMRDEFNRGGTMVGVARARDLSNGKTISASTIMRMVSYFARHEVDKSGRGWSPGTDGYPSAGRIAWLLWGGDPGRTWANAMARRIRAQKT